MLISLPVEHQSDFQLSFWEQQTYFSSCDVLVVGGGLVGLFSALEMKMREPSLSVVVLDRGPFLPYGASTRNAGFACFGSISELLDDLKTLSQDQVFSLVERRYKGLLKMRSLLGDDAIAYESFGGTEVFTRMEDKLADDCLGSMDRFNAALKSITGLERTYVDSTSEVGGCGFSGVTRMIQNRGEGQLDAGRMMRALLGRTRAAGVEVLTGIGVEKIDESSDHVQLYTSHGFSIKAQRVLVTTNAFARQLLPELDVRPGRAQVLVTNPIDGLKVKGSFHYDRGYYYFRNVGDRILFGGGRNLDFSGETTTEFGLTGAIQSRLEELLKSMILPDVPYSIEQRWSGIMGLGPDRLPIVKRVSQRVFCA
ncbi:MAG: NAD(P)/FAD-dependent oxidoreductase, partial [Bacteroidota bacterium]